MDPQPEDKPYPRYFYPLILGVVGLFGTLGAFLVASLFATLNFGMSDIFMYAVIIGGVLAIAGWAADRE